MAERDPHIIGARIAKRRHQLDMTQEQLADALGVSKSTVANWERGVAYPKRKLGKIEQVLGPLDSDDEEPRSPSSSTADALDRLQLELDRLRQALRDERPGKDSDDYRASAAI
jgi:transcriptional regulator with XRE-family HTH domain